MIERVAAQIEKLNEQYGELLRLAKEKTEVLKGNDHAAVACITEKEQTAIELARQTENERMESVAALAGQWGLAPQEVDAAMLIEKCAPGDAERMKNAVSALSETLRALKEQNERNAQLLEIKMRMTAFILEASSVGANNDPGNYYSMDGTELEKDVETRPRFIDSEI